MDEDKTRKALRAIIVALSKVDSYTRQDAREDIERLFDEQFTEEVEDVPAEAAKPSSPATKPKSDADITTDGIQAIRSGQPFVRPGGG